MYRRGYQEDRGSMYQDNHDDHHDDDDHHAMKEEEPDMKSMRAKVDYWSGYYDFLINEGSYKFWAVFQVSFDEFHQYDILRKRIKYRISNIRIMFNARFLLENNLSFDVARILK